MLMVIVFLDSHFQGVLVLHLTQVVEPTLAALLFHHVWRIRQDVQLIEDETRDNQRTAKEACFTQTPDAPINDDIRINEKRRILGRVLAEANVRNEEREFLAVCPNGK